MTVSGIIPAMRTTQKSMWLLTEKYCHAHSVLKIVLCCHAFRHSILFIKNYEIRLPVLLFLVLHWFLHKQIYFLQIFKSFSTLSEKINIFDTYFPLLTDLLNPLTARNAQNPLSLTKVFC